MKKILLALVLIYAGITAFTPAHEGHGQKAFGEKIDTTGAIEISELKAMMSESGEMPVKIKGTIAQVCQAKGCWFKYQSGDEQVMVKMKDHAFYIPKDQGGSFAYVEGTAKMDTTSVAMLQHYAEDAGKSDEEIAGITEPEVELIIIASGVVIR